MLPGISWRLFRFLGISIEINLTWLIIFAITALTLINNFLPFLFPNKSVLAYIFLGLAATIMFFVSIIVHELSHSYIAVKNGINIRKIVLFIFGGISEMKGEVNNPKIEFKMALAGPMVSFSVAIVLGLLAAVLGALGVDRMFTMTLGYLMQLNVFLALFNLLPGFPLDGGRILRAAIWKITDNISRATAIAANFGELLAVGFILAGLFVIVRGSFINGIWIMLIGWFIGQAAIASYEHTKNLLALASTSIRDIMTTKFVPIPASTTIEDAISKYFVKYHYGRFPVERLGHIVGIVTLKDIDKVPREQWNLITVDSIAKSITKQKRISPDQPAAEAMNVIEQGAPHVLAYENEKVVGIVTRNDILKAAKQEKRAA